MGNGRPALVNFYTDTAVIVLHSDGSSWAAQRMPHRMGRPPMESLIWNATSNKPFGRNILMGVLGSFVGEFLFGLLGIHASGSFSSFAISVIGACICIWVGQKISK